MSRPSRIRRSLAVLIAAVLCLGGLNAPALRALGCDSAKKADCPCCHHDAGACGQAACALSGQPAGPQAATDEVEAARPAALPAALALISLSDPSLRPPLAVPAPRPAAPPGQIGFAEQVLQESLFAHAPPAV